MGAVLSCPCAGGDTVRLSRALWFDIACQCADALAVRYGLFWAAWAYGDQSIRQGVPCAPAVAVLPATPNASRSDVDGKAACGVNSVLNAGAIHGSVRSPDVVDSDIAASSEYSDIQFG